MDLLERENVLSTLNELLTGARAGHGSMAILNGEAGIGKTAVCRRFAELQARVTSLSGSCDPLATPRPLGPLVDIAEAAGGALQRGLRGEQPRDRLFGLLLDLLRRKPGPTLIVIEDAHWADEATLDLLRFLGRRVESTFGLVIITCRDDELKAGHPLRVVIGELASVPAVHRIVLRRLSLDAVRTLARGRHPDPDAIYQATGGNPFFVTEILRGTPDEVPASVRDAVEARISRLSMSARESVRTLAALGLQIPDHVALDRLGIGPDAIEECVHAGLLDWDAGRLSFRHELVRMAVADSTPPAQRREVHRRILGLLRSDVTGSPDPADFADHAERAGDRDAVIEFAPQAAQRAERLGAHREAAAQYARALRWSDGLDPGRRVEWLAAHSRESLLTGAIAEALASAEQTLRLRREIGDPVAVGDAMRWLATLLEDTDRKAEALPLARSAVATLEGLEPSRELAAAYVAVGGLHSQAAEMAQAGLWAERGLELADRLKFEDVRIQALRVLGTAKLCSPAEDGWPELTHALELALARGDTAQAAGAYQQINWFGAMHRQFRLSGRQYEAALGFCEAHDLTLNRLRLLEAHSVELMHEGRWTEAADLATALLNQPGIATVDRIQPLYVLGRIRARRGDPEVWPPLDEALRIAEPRRELAHLGNVRAARAEAAWLQGDPKQAAGEAAGVFELSLLSQDPWIVGELAFWMWRGGGLRELPTCAFENPYGLQIRGLAKPAAAAWLRLGCPFEAACALLDSNSEADLRHALRRLERLGSAPGAAMAARRLRSMGVRGVRRGATTATRANPFQLTNRELEVLQLVAHGRTDAEIAAKLFLSARTVNHHVSASLGKLGVRSRMEAVQKLTAPSWAPQKPI